MTSEPPLRSTFRMPSTWTVASLPTIAAKLPAYGRFVNLNGLSYLFLVVTRFQQRFNLVSLFIGELHVCHRCSFDLVGLRVADLTAAHLLFQLDKVALQS